MVTKVRRTPRPRTRQIRRAILERAFTRHSQIGTEVGRAFGISRQAVNRHIRALVEEGVLLPRGNTRARSYRLAYEELARFQVSLEPGVEEHEEWRQNVAPVLPELRKNVRDILNYAFNEMMNNAIDHSEGSFATVVVQSSAATIRVTVADNGVGVFRKLQDAFGLPDAQTAILELSKGKLTTDPRRHTGEGIFFTSRLCDKFSLFSGSSGWVTMPGKAELIMDSPSGLGTLVFMEIETWAERTMNAVFEKYTTDDDNQFSQTTVPVLFAEMAEDTLVSRSAARRVLARLDRFKRVRLDFAHVDEIGQPFADEIFRVFANEHPEVKLFPMNANRQVMSMIRRAQSARPV